MKIYIREYEPDDNISAEELFPYKGKHYLYKLEIDDEGTGKLEDICGRFVPFDRDDMESIANAFSFVRDSAKVTELFSNWREQTNAFLAKHYTGRV